MPYRFEHEIPLLIYTWYVWKDFLITYTLFTYITANSFYTYLSTRHFGLYVIIWSITTKVPVCTLLFIQKFGQFIQKICCTSVSTFLPPPPWDIPGHCTLLRVQILYIQFYFCMLNDYLLLFSLKNSNIQRSCQNMYVILLKCISEL